MGSAHSIAESIVNAEISAGISVVQNVIVKNSVSIDNINEIDLKNCTLNVNQLNMGNYASIDMSTLSSAIMDSETQQDMRQAIKQAADAAAMNALGVTSSNSKAISNSITTISAAISNTMQAETSASGSGSNLFKCESSAVNVRIFNMKNLTDDVQNMTSTSKLISSAKQTAIQDITSQAKALSKGYDLGTLGMIALGVIAVLVLSYVMMVTKGVDVLIGTLTSFKFWFLLGLGGSVISLVFSSFYLSKTWPYKINDDDGNKKKLKAFGISMGISLCVVLGAGLGIYLSRDKQESTL
jgi:hypothetical protein